MQHPLLCALSTVIGMAQSHVEDIERGIDDGTYCAAENADLPAKQAAVARIATLVASLHEKESGLNDLISAALRFNTSQIISSQGIPICKGVLDTRERRHRAAHDGRLAAGSCRRRYPSRVRQLATA